MIEAISLIRRLAHDRFYGVLTLKFEAGRIVTIKKEQTLKPADLSGKPRNEDGSTERE